MGKAATKALLILSLFFFYASLSSAAGVASPFNGLTLDLDDNVEEYTFLLGGHLYGAPGNSSVYPASSVLANIDMMNARGAKFFVSLGDNFRETEEIYITNYQDSFASKLNTPLFNAVGNHDVTNRKLYEATFGETYYHFVYNNDLFVFLDGELDGGNIVGDQLDFFLNVIRTGVDNPDINHVFIFSHKLIWDVNNPDYQIVFDHANRQYSDNNFKSELEPVLIELARDKPVYWFSGDIGVSRSLPLFYQQEPNHNITYGAVGMVDTDRDVIIQVTVSQSNGVAFTPISLTGQVLPPIEDYDLDYWEQHFEEPEESVLRVYLGKVLQILLHRYFWMGFFVAIPVLGLVVFLLFRRPKGSKTSLTSS